MYKIYNGLVPTEVKEKFIVSTSMHNCIITIHVFEKKKATICLVLTSYGQKIVRFRGTKFWIYLDSILKNATWYTFKKELKNQHIQTCNA